MFWNKRTNTTPGLIAHKDKTPPRKISLVTGMIVGGAIGSVISLLLAPDTGKATREKVAKKGRVLYEKGKSRAEIFIENYNQRIKKEIGEA